MTTGTTLRNTPLTSLHEAAGARLVDFAGFLMPVQYEGILEEANLIAVVRRGREKLHYLNPVPIFEIADRWIGKYERGRLRALGEMKKALESQNDE